MGMALRFYYPIRNIYIIDYMLQGWPYFHCVYRVTRMTTSISSEARWNQTSILIMGRENHGSPKPDGQTYGRTDRRTDIHTDFSMYRVASLLKTTTWKII